MPLYDVSPGRTPGQILQHYFGNGTASDFVFSSSSYTASGFPTNSTFTKLSATSFLDVRLTGDFVSPGTVPNSIYMGLFIDGSNYEAVNHHVSLSSAFCTVVLTKIIGNPATDLLTAGSHTLSVNVATQGGQSTTFNCHTAADLEIIEFEPVF